MCHNKDTETKNSHLFYLLASAPIFKAHDYPQYSSSEVKSGHPRGGGGTTATSFLKYIWFSFPNLPAFLSFPFFPLTLLRALILLSASSLKTLASNNWKKWLFKDNCNLLNMPGYHMLSALKLQINDEQEQWLSFRGNWPLSNGTSLMSSVYCISLCEFHGV